MAEQLCASGLQPVFGSGMCSPSIRLPAAVGHTQVAYKCIPPLRPSLPSQVASTAHAASCQRHRAAAVAAHALPSFVDSAPASTAHDTTTAAAARSVKAQRLLLMSHIKGCHSWQELRAVYNAALSDATAAEAAGVMKPAHIAAFASTLVKVGLATEAAGVQEKLECSR